MFKSLHPGVEAAGIFFVLAILAAIADCRAQDVKYCKNYQTGEIVVVEANMPCPFPTAEL
jgi:hypothetical protein